jgi:hypothetical protein
VSEADPAGFPQTITSGPFHHALADEPEGFGGTGRGMSPYGFLAAGLGACTSMTLRMYARRKGWPLAHIRVGVSHGKAHCPDSASGDGRLDVFRPARGQRAEAREDPVDPGEAWSLAAWISGNRGSILDLMDSGKANG